MHVAGWMCTASRAGRTCSQREWVPRRSAGQRPGAGWSNRKDSSVVDCQWSALQREERVGAGGCTHGIRHQADVRHGHLRWPERQLYEVQLTPRCCWAVSPLLRLLPCRANWRYRPIAVTQRSHLLAVKRSHEELQADAVTPHVNPVAKYLNQSLAVATTIAPNTMNAAPARTRGPLRVPHSRNTNADTASATSALAFVSGAMMETGTPRVDTA